MENLKKLQLIEEEILELKATRDRLQKEGKELTSALDAAQEEVDRLQSSIEESQQAMREFRTALAEGQERVVKSEKRLLEIRTTKEQLAVTREKETAKQSNRELQEKIKEKEDEIGRTTKEKEERELALEQIREKAGEHNTEAAPRLAVFDQTLEEKLTSRRALLANLTPSLQRRYQILIEQRGGVAVVEARNGACLGCNMRLPPQFFNSLYRCQEIQACPHCNRFLYIIEEKSG